MAEDFDNKLGYILAVAFFGMMGGALMGPVLPALIERFGVTEETVGLVLGVYTLTTAVTMPFVGPFIDKIGRKQVLIIFLFINGLFGSLCSLAPNFTVLLIFRALQGIGIAGLMPVAMTLIDDYYHRKGKVRAMDRLSITTSIGGVLAPLLGGALAYLNWQYPFLFYGLTIPLAIVLSFNLPQPSRDVNEKGLKQYFTEMSYSFKQLDILAVVASAFLLFFLLYTIVTYLPIKLVRELGFTEMQAGLVLAAQAISTAIIAFNIEKIKERSTNQTILGSGFLFSGAAVFLLSKPTSFWLIIPLLGVFGIGMGLVDPVINDLITTLAPEEAVGGVTSIYNTMKYVGQTAAPISLGALLIYYPRPIAFLASGSIGIIGSSVALIYIWKEK